MKILAFETSAKAVSVALLQEDKLLAESYQNTGLTHSQTLMVMAQDLLKQCDVSVSDLDAIAVANGPGSFTGVRIGAAAAKGLSWGAEKPLVGVSTLEAMAYSFGAWQGYVCPVMDARRAQVYNALFSVENGKITRIREDRAISLAELGEELATIGGPVFLVGDGSELTFRTLSETLPQLVLPEEHRRHQRAVGVAKVARQMLLGGYLPDAAALTPNYLRLSQAEREKLEKKKEK